MQTTTDLRARFANVMDEARQEEAPAQAPAPRPYVTQGRIDLIRTMLFERFDAAEAQQRFDHFDWAKMPKDKFGQIYTWLRQVPKRENTASKGEPVPAPKGDLPLVEGRFTVVFEDGSHKTLRIRRQDENKAFKPGALLVSHLTGPDNSNDYTSVGHVTESGNVAIWRKHRDNKRLAEAIRVLVGDPLAAIKAYAQMSQHCGFCGLPLTHPTSLECLYGERCAEKYGLPWG